ncbi:hypothetical protein DRV85_12325, partial [Rhodosalinus halophilus]
MAIISTLTNTSTPIAANVSGNVYLIGPDAIVTTTGDAVDGNNTSTSKRIVVQGSLIAEQDGIDLGSAGTGGFNQIHVTRTGYIFAESDGIEAEGGSNVVVNEGSIFAANDGMFILGDGNRITNYGDVTGTSDGIDVTGNFNILTNHGRLTGGDEGLEISGDGNRIVNYGAIVTSNDFVGNEAVEVSHNAGETSFLYNYGTIGGIGAYAGGQGADTIVNEGAITGEVRTNLGDDVIRNSGSIDGHVELSTGDDQLFNRGLIFGDVNLGGSNDLFDGRNGEIVGTVTGGLGDDTILGGTGDDTVNGGAGADILEGGAGVDTVSYVFDTTGVTVRLWNGTGAGGEAAGDVIS